MTAEAVIMNKHAVAMAADSAVTLSGQKVFNTANKVFALSKYHPVGLMIYGNAELGGIPWETLVKVFRQQIEAKSFPTVEGYVHAFFDFVQSLIGVETAIGEERQEACFVQGVCGLFVFLRQQMLTRLEELFGEDGEPTADDVGRVVSNVIGEYYDWYRASDFSDGMTVTEHRQIKGIYRHQLKKWREKVFEQLPLSPLLVRQLNDLAAGIFSKAGAMAQRVNVASFSGLVIAGYGEEQIFPSLREYELFGIVGGHIIYESRRSTDIGRGNDALIVPFAQGADMATRFMEGVDPQYQALIEGSLRELWGQSLDVVIDAIAELDDAQKECYKQRAKTAGSGLLDSYIQGLKECREKAFWGPVISVVASLPKDELAEMAESLVNLTSLKMKVSGEQETVGGPIDVAVISKGDGLIWIKRKHYFKPELNQHFFKNYYRETNDDDGTEKPKEG